MHDLFTKHRTWFIIIPLLLTLGMVYPLRFAKINPDLMKYLPEDIDAKINIEKVEETFGKFDPVLIILGADDILDRSSLIRLEHIHSELIRLKECDDIISLFNSKYIRGEGGIMLADPVIRKIPDNESGVEELRSEIINNPFAYDLLVSEDFRYTLIIFNPVDGSDDTDVFEKIDQVVSGNEGHEKVYFAGLPYFRYEIQKRAIRDLMILFPIGLLIMFLFLFFSFREIRGVLLPFSVVLMSVIAAMGMMPLLNFDLSLIAVLIPIMMIAIANNYGVHIVARYQELNASNPELKMMTIVQEVMGLLYIPLILTALTTIIGILGLVVHIMVPARHMGIVSAAGIGFALILSLFFIPAIMTGLKKGEVKKIRAGFNRSVIDRFLCWSGRAVTKKPVIVISLFFVLFVIAGAGIFRLNVSINLEKMMPSTHPIRISNDISNRYFGGNKNISVLFEGDILDPDVMHTIDKFEDSLKILPEVGNVTSLATVIKAISRALYDKGDEYYDVIPDQREAIAQYLEFYNMSGDYDDFERMADFNYTRALMNIQFRSPDIGTFKKVNSRIESLISSTPYSTLMAGQSLIEKEIAESIVRGQIYSLIFAIVAIAFLLWAIFKSISAGLLGIIPLLFALVCNFGLMGWTGFDLDIATSLLSSVAIGIGVDYIIHFFWRYKHELSKESSCEKAVLSTITTTGRGITINALSVITGFSVLLLSGLTILKTFGLLIIFSLVLCLLCSLLLVPAICLLYKPRFLKPLVQ